MGIAWIIGFTIYFRKRYMRRKLKRKIAAGKATGKQKPSKIPEEKVIVPPDPAVLLGHRHPGERAFRDGKASDFKHDERTGDSREHLNGIELESVKPPSSLNDIPPAIPPAAQEKVISLK